MSVALVWWGQFGNMEDLAGYFLQALRYLWAFVKFSFFLKGEGLFHKERLSFILPRNDFRVDKKGALVQIQIRI